MGCKNFSFGVPPMGLLFSLAQVHMLCKHPPLHTCQAKIGFVWVSSEFQVIAFRGPGSHTVLAVLLKMQPCLGPDQTRTRTCLVPGDKGLPCLSGVPLS